MTLVPGNILVIKLPFADGSISKKQRPYVVIEADDKKVTLLNISSVEGKEKKLLLKSNFELVGCIPPLLRASFVKLDEVYHVEMSQLLIETSYKRKGFPKFFSEIKLNEIVERHNNYALKNKIHSLHINKEKFIQYNYTTSFLSEVAATKS